MSDEALNFRITAQDLASAKFAGVNKQLGGMQGAAGKAQGALRGLGIGGFAVATLAVAGFATALADGIHQAIEDETSIKRLGASLKANVPGWDGNTKAIEKRIDASQRLGFADDEMRASLALLVGATHDVGKAQELQNAAMDLARLKGIDLASASDALIKVEGGRYRILASLGIQLGKNATKEQVLAAIQKVAGGQAEAFGKTTAGAAAAAGIAFDELKEDIGRQLMPVLLNLAKWVRSDLIPTIRSIGEGIGKVGKFIGDLSQTFDTVGIDFGDMGDRVHAIADDVGSDFTSVKQQIVNNMRDAGMSFEEAADAAQVQFKRIGKDGAAELDLGGKGVRLAAARLAGAIPDEVTAGADDAADEAGKIPEKMADAMLDAQFSLSDATSQLVEFMKKAISPAEQMMQAKAFLASQAYRNGMASGIPSVVQKTIELRNQALATINNLSGVGTGGAAFAYAWINALVYRLNADRWRVAQALYGYKAMLVPSSPSPPKGPLHNAHLGAMKIGVEYAKALGLGLGTFSMPTTKLGDMAALSPNLGPMAGLSLPAPAGGGGGGVTEVHTHLYLDGKEIADNVTRHQYYGRSGASRLPRG